MRPKAQLYATRRAGCSWPRGRSRAAWSAVAADLRRLRRARRSARVVVTRSVAAAPCRGRSASWPRRLLLSRARVRPAVGVVAGARHRVATRIAAAAAAGALVCCHRVDIRRRGRVGLFLLRAPGGSLRPRPNHAEHSRGIRASGCAGGRVRADRLRAVPRATGRGRADLRARTRAGDGGRVRGAPRRRLPGRPRVRRASRLADVPLRPAGGRRGHRGVGARC